MIGLTGGIASGKSTVAQRLRALGAVVLDADLLAREAVKPHTPGWHKVQEAFPDVIRADGAIDRRLLGQIVFADPEKRRVLESIIHPEVLKMLVAEAARAEGEGRVVVAEVPLLYEVGWDGLMEQVWVVYVPYEVQLRRLMERSGVSQGDAERMIGSQMPLARKVELAHRVIDNSGPLEKTWEQVDALWKEFAG